MLGRSPWDAPPRRTEVDAERTEPGSRPPSLETSGLPRRSRHPRLRPTAQGRIPGERVSTSACCVSHDVTWHALAPARRAVRHGRRARPPQRLCLRPPQRCSSALAGERGPLQSGARCWGGEACFSSRLALNSEQGAVHSARAKREGACTQKPETSANTRAGVNGRRFLNHCERCTPPCVSLARLRTHPCIHLYIISYVRPY